MFSIIMIAIMIISMTMTTSSIAMGGHAHPVLLQLCWVMGFVQIIRVFFLGVGMGTGEMQGGLGNKPA